MHHVHCRIEYFFKCKIQSPGHIQSLSAINRLLYDTKHAIIYSNNSHTDTLTHIHITPHTILMFLAKESQFPVFMVYISTNMIRVS